MNKVNVYCLYPQVMEKSFVGDPLKTLCADPLRNFCAVGKERCYHRQGNRTGGIAVMIFSYCAAV